MTELVHLDVADGVATITLDSPHNKNALSQQLTGELLARLEAAGADDAVRAIVIRSALDVFCSGADLSEATTVGMGVGAQRMVDVQRAIVANPKPVVARVAGPVRAGGIGIVAAADISVAGRERDVRADRGPARSRRGDDLAHGPPPAHGPRGGVHLPDRQRLRRPRGRPPRAPHPGGPGRRPGRAVDTVLTSLLKGAPQGLRETKKLLNRELLADIDARGKDLAELSASLFGSPAAQEAMLIFLNRKKS